MLVPISRSSCEKLNSRFPKTMSERSARLPGFRLAAILVAALVGAFAFSAFWSNAPQTPTEQSGRGTNSEPHHSTDYPDHSLQKPDLPSNDFVGSAACSCDNISSVVLNSCSLPHDLHIIKPRLAKSAIRKFPPY